MNRGILMVISGPSGVGKGTVCKAFISRHPNVFLSVSATTRAPREGEQDGVHYYFLSPDEFEQGIQAGRFLEHAVFCGNSYGTPRDKIEEMLEHGKHVILEIEPQGAMQIKEKMPESILIFTLPPSFEELKNRLEGRQTESPEVIEKRLARAREECRYIKDYDYILLNDTVEKALERLEHIVCAEECKIYHNQELIDEVF